MTEKLYFTDSHMKEFDAEVVSCTAADKGYEIILNKSAFFPEGGGQASDTGRLICGTDISNVTYCFERGEDTVHLCDVPLSEGSKVHGEIDWEKRFRRMQNHSGEHIVSGIAHNLYGCTNVGFHMGSDEVTLDFDRELTADQVEELEKLANAAVWQNVRFISFFPTEKELESIDFRSKKEIKGAKVRLVRVEGYDICACCAPHVERSGEIGIIKISGFMKYKGGVRLRLLCGRDALDHYNGSMESIKNISVLLSAKYHEVYEAVTRLNDELKKEKEEKAKLCSALSEKIISSLEDGKENIVIFDTLLDQKSCRAIANAGAAKCTGICAVFSGEDGRFTYIMASANIDLKKKAAEINTALNGRGGGSATMITGNVLCTMDEISAYFNE